MRIEAYTQVQQVYQSQHVGKTQKGSVAGQKDQLQISSLGRELQVAKAAVKESPDIREDLVASIKSRIDNGTYEVSNEDFAASLLEKYEEMR